jgi:hypothetical protein
MEIPTTTLKAQQDRINRLRLIDQIINAELEERVFLQISHDQRRYLTMKELIQIEGHMEHILSSVREILSVQSPDLLLEAA